MPGLVLLGLAAAATLAAVPGPTADEVIARSVEAQGGLQRIRAVQTVRMTGSMSAGAMEMPMTLEFKRPSRIRAEQTVRGQRTVQGYDGRRAWVIPPGGRRAEALPPEAVAQMAQRADFEGPLVDYKAKGSQAELVGRERLEQGDAYRIKLTHADGQSEFYLVDARSWLLVRVEAKRTVQGRVIDGETTLSGYRESGGWKWPMLIESSVKGMPEQTITFSGIEVNLPLDDTRFQMPAAAPQGSVQRPSDSPR
ncbi:MAG TPA: hypothetical protein VMX54_05315 [Vicinamibacteria bacterium]|nr:hypothetical protein [Vicinamibacteria bacterium]